MMRAWRYVFAALLLAAVGIQAGCDMLTPDDRALVRSFAEEWMRSRDMHPQNEDGSVNWTASINLTRRALTGRSGNAEVDAVLDGYEVLSNLHQADQLMEQGRAEDNPDLMDEAITRRPGDWTYRTSRAALALAAGDTATHEAQQAEAEDIVRQNNIDPVWYHQQSIRDYDRPADQMTSNPQCKAVVNEMIHHYVALVELTGEPAYGMQVEALVDFRDLSCP